MSTPEDAPYKVQQREFRARSRVVRRPRMDGQIPWRRPKVTQGGLLTKDKGRWTHSIEIDGVEHIWKRGNLVKVP